MANLTLSIDDDVLRLARIKALEEGTSVNAVVRRQITDYVASLSPAAAFDEFVSAAQRSRASSGTSGRQWTRDDLYAERVRPR